MFVSERAGTDCVQYGPMLLSIGLIVDLKRRSVSVTLDVFAIGLAEDLQIQNAGAWSGDRFQVAFDFRLAEFAHTVPPQTKARAVPRVLPNRQKTEDEKSRA